MHMDPIMPLLTGIVAAVLLIGFVLRRLKQPYVIAYLTVGILLGPYGLAFIADPIVLNRLGSIGVLVLLFFVGMEISLPRLLSNWKVAVLGTVFQILVSVLAVGVIGVFFDWPLSRSLLLGFVISLSSTAVVITMLEEWGEVDTEVGGDVIGVLLVQDLAIIPMFIVIQLMGGGGGSLSNGILQVIGGSAIIGLLIWLNRRREIRLPLSRYLRAEPEMQVFGALGICFGLALLTDVFKLSTALGAFIAGILISAARETEWVHKNLKPFHVVFVALFFVSIGLLLDLDFLRRHWQIVLALVVAAFATNTFINAVLMRFLGVGWRRSLYAGALLSQIGEFSFVLAAIGRQYHLISEFAYQTTIAVISLTLLLSPPWILFFRRWTRTEKTHARIEGSGG